MNLLNEWKDLNKKYTLSETNSIVSDIKTSCFNVYVRIDKGNYNYEYIKQSFYYVVTFEKNEYEVFCTPTKIEKKYF